MRIGSLFSGVGGLELGLEWAGLGETIWQVEIDEYCGSILKKHWPNARRHSDVRAVTGSILQPVDLICGGFPCQDVSGAGSGSGLKGARSGLWYEFERIVSQVQPTWVVVENVASGSRRWVDAVRRGLGQQGYETLPVPIAAMDVGAPHRRRRIFIIGRRAATNAVSEPVRDERERRPRGWQGELFPQGDAEPAHDGGSGPAADPDGGGREGERGQAQRGVERAPRRKPDRRGSSRKVSPGTAALWAGNPWATEPGICGVATGPSSKLDRARLKAIGNGVVPQCAQVIGEIINIMRSENG